LSVKSVNADFGLRIFNPDGSEAEKSGNGLRIFAKYLYDYKHAPSPIFSIETAGGIVRAEVLEEVNGNAQLIKVDMGKANFSSPEIPVNCEKPECLDQALQLRDKEFQVNCVSVGNPHCVILTDELDENEVKVFGPQIENNRMFPNRINVQFAKVLSENETEIMIWERGAGWTLASGSSSCAVASVLVKKGLVQPQLTVKMPGGKLQIEIDKSWNIRMSGPVREIASGVLSGELLSDIAPFTAQSIVSSIDFN
jgi:diaminopimelate epimerase